MQNNLEYLFVMCNRIVVIQYRYSLRKPAEKYKKKLMLCVRIKNFIHQLI